MSSGSVLSDLFLPKCRADHGPAWSHRIQSHAPISVRTSVHRLFLDLLLWFLLYLNRKRHGLGSLVVVCSLSRLMFRIQKSVQCQRLGLAPMGLAEGVACSGLTIPAYRLTAERFGVLSLDRQPIESDSLISSFSFTSICRRPSKFAQTDIPGGTKNSCTVRAVISSSDVLRGRRGQITLGHSAFPSPASLSLPQLFSSERNAASAHLSRCVSPHPSPARLLQGPSFPAPQRCFPTGRAVIPRPDTVRASQHHRVYLGSRQLLALRSSQ